jgi:hypothetical protein
MESVVRNVVEPFFEIILKRLTDLDKKIIILDTKIIKLENEVLVLGCKIDNNLTVPYSSSNTSIMEEVD